MVKTSRYIKQIENDTSNITSYVKAITKKLKAVLDRIGRIYIDLGASLDANNHSIYDRRPSRLHRPAFLILKDTPNDELSRLLDSNEEQSPYENLGSNINLNTAQLSLESNKYTNAQITVKAFQKQTSFYQ